MSKSTIEKGFGNINVLDYGAVGDGTTDDTMAFRRAMTACNYERPLYIPTGIYKITDTILNKSRGIYGSGNYMDSSAKGTQLYFVPTDTTDLKPCIEFGTGEIFDVENLSVFGSVVYTSRYLSTWVDKTQYDLDNYAMFSAGPCAFRVTNSCKPIFKNIRTKNIKVGLLLDSNTGHVDSYECNWSGLIGMYCRRNSEDYYFEGGSITGAFTGVMFGMQLWAGHRGGITAQFKRVHMGFSPYSFYQVKDDTDYDTLSQYSSIGGMNCTLDMVRFEQVGEAAIKLLAKSTSQYLRITGFGPMTWSVIDYNDTAGRWQYSIPDDLKLPASKQAYACYFGTLLDPVKIDNTDGNCFKSTISGNGAVGSAYIYYHNTRDSNITGLDPDNCTVVRKRNNGYVSSNIPYKMIENMQKRALDPFSGSNLLKNPEVLSNWTVTNGGTLSIVTDYSTIPVALTNDLKMELGTTPVVIKITPNGTLNPILKINFNTYPTVLTTGRNICMSFWAYCGTRGRVRARLDSSSAKYVYDDTLTTATTWAKFLGVENRSSTDDYYTLEAFDFSANEDNYICGVMVCADYPRAYSATQNHIAVVDVEVPSLTLTPKVSALPTASSSYRGRILLIDGGTGVAEVSSINFTHGCTTDGNIIITLNNVDFTVAVAAATEITATDVATKVRGQTFAGWTTGGTGSAVTFTATAAGGRVDPVVTVGATGVTASVTVTTQGVSSYGDSVYICKLMADGTYAWVQLA